MNVKEKLISKIQEKIPVLSVFFIFLFFTFALTSVFVNTAHSEATPPSIITYQGKLMDDGTSVDATTTIALFIYDSAAGDTLLYTAGGTMVATSTIEVPVSNGIFSVNMGAAGTNDVTSSIFANNATLYLEVWVEGTKLSPRKRLNATPYAMNSAYLMGYGAATASTSAYIPLADANGNFTFSGTPQSSGVGGGSLYVNPAMADADETLFGVGVTGGERFRVDFEGDTWVFGNLTASGDLASFNTTSISGTFDVTGTSTLSNLTITDGITLGGDKRTSWPAGGGDVTEAGNNDFTGINTFATTTLATTTIDGIFDVNADSTLNTTSISGTFDVTGTSTLSNLTITDGITLGGEKRTTWLDGDVVAAENNTFTGINIFATTTFATTTISGIFDVNALSTFNTTTIGDTLTVVGTSTLSNIDVTDGITLGGEKRTTWAVGGDVTEAGNNDFIGLNTFAATTTFTTTTFSGAMSVTATSTMTNIQVTDGITLGGDKRTSWPAGGGDVTEAGNNDFTGLNTFAVTTTFNGVADIRGRIAGVGTLGSFNDFGTLGGVSGVVVYGDYAFALAPFNNALTSIDISDPTNPTVIGTTGLDAAFASYGTIALSGNYVYTILGNSGSFEVTDISNPVSPAVVGSLTISGSGRDIFIAGNYAYIASGASDRVIVVDISDPRNPVEAAILANGGSIRLDDPYSIAVDGKYAYVAAKTSDAMTILDVSDPRNPVFVTSSIHGGPYALNGARSIAVSGKYVYVGSDTSNAIQIIDVSDPQNPSPVGSYTGAGSAFWSGNDVYTIVPTDKYLYVKAGGEFFIIDVHNPASPSLVREQNVGIADISSGSRSTVVYGNKIAVVDYGFNAFYLLDVSGATIAHTDIGSANIADLHVRNNTQIGGQVDIRGGLSVGNSGLLLNGSFSMFNATSSNSVTNTLRFSNIALFETTAATTNTHAFIFNTKNTLTVATSSYLFSIRNNGTPAFSVSANGNVHATGSYYGVSANFGTPGAPGDLAERVDIAVDDEVEAGDVVVVDPDSTDTYRRSNSPYSQQVSGVISTNPTIIVGNGKTEHTAIMAMIGRVPIKVSAENGPILRGDLLITATSTGYAMRYDASKDTGHISGIVGVALESLGEGKGKIMGLVRTGWVNGDYRQTFAGIREELAKLALAQTNVQNTNTVTVVQNSDGTIHPIESNLNLNGYSILAVKSIRGLNEKWAIDEDGRFTTTVDTSAGAKTLYALQSGESQYVFSGSGTLENGIAHVEFDETIRDIIDSEKTMSINLTLTQKAKGIFVSDRDGAGFDVEEVDGGQSSATFDWLVFATRKNTNEINEIEDVDEDSAVSEEGGAGSTPEEETSNTPSDVVDQSSTEEPSEPVSDVQEEVLVPEDSAPEPAIAPPAEAESSGGDAPAESDSSGE